MFLFEWQHEDVSQTALRNFFFSSARWFTTIEKHDIYVCPVFKVTTMAKARGMCQRVCQ